MFELDKLCLHCMGQLDHPGDICPHCGADPAETLNAPNQLECGSILAGTYLIGSVLGQGGFGITYIGLDLNLNMKVAIKEYYPEGYVTREGQTRTGVVPLPGERKVLFERGRKKFVDEAQILARFSDEPAIVGVRGFFHENGTAYIVMSFVEGVTLKEYAAQRGGKLPAREVLNMMEPLFASLSRVHEAGLLHRDISPDNIMRKKNGSLVLLDFGAARQMSVDGEHTNTVNVKIGFAPVEQFYTHGEQGAWTDVYALCATIYRLTTGVTPQNAFERATSDVPLLPPNKLGADFTPAQQQAILHGLAIRADRRTRSIEQLQRELKAESAAPVVQPVVDPPERGSKPNPAGDTRKKTKLFGKTEKTIAVLIAVVAMVAVALVVLITTNQSENDVTAGNPVVTIDADTAEQAPSGQATPEPTEAPRIFAPVGTVIEGHVAAGSDYSLVLLDDGTVRCYGGMTSGVYEDVQTWSNIVYISGYDNHAVGLRENGTLVPAGMNERGELDVRELANVTQVVTGYLHTVALTADGKVHYCGYNKHNRADCEKWTNVKKLLGGDDHLAAILNDGTMVAAGYNEYKECNLSEVTNAIGGAVSSCTTYVLNADHTVSDIGKNWCGEDDVFDWTDIIYVDGGDEHTVGLQSNGSVKVAGSNSNNQLAASSWENIVAICAGKFHTVGIDMYGVIHITGPDGEAYCSGDGDTIWQ